MARLYCEADLKVAILDLFEAQDLPARLGGQAGSGAYSCLSRSLRFDLIRDLWAFSLDRDDRAPSIAHLSREFEDPMTRNAVRIQFAEAGLSAWLELESAHCVALNVHSACVDYWSASLAAFDDTLCMLRTGARSLLDSDRARRLNLARNQGIAHYSMVKGRDKKHSLFDLSSLRLEFRDPQRFLIEAEPIILNIVLLLAGARFDVGDVKRGNRARAENLWSNIVNMGDRVGEGGVALPYVFEFRSKKARNSSPRVPRFVGTC